ncbi:ferritin-like domain-containing protein [Roseisolibacter sp. H3M3-2]|uniref:ferritin-like domain-containing protein n=1 Tax=Roseisolibacter sp. H3M3-2 TaxID=3031323 RepID=UPI0023DA924D|nr:ferritin-like domain-containing protein [Roseisolibacter sp. H3M3-2]MDF1503949.1 ferritin-like domain-containing protein [Roseisolibacter sp. H3M3-2]
MDQQQPILAALASNDPEAVSRMGAPLSRRAALKGGAAATAGLATVLRAASAPVALAAMARDAFGQTGGLPQAVVDIFNFALTLEELEAEFYVRAVQSGVLPANVVPIFTTIRDHELAHVAFLRQSLGAQAVAKPTFDFTAGNGSGRGPYADVFRNYATLTAVAQAFEDTGVRAYKGQAPNLRPFRGPDGNNFALQVALQVHSVEARHAAQIRRLRGTFNELDPFYQGWITGNRTDVPGANAVYAGEQNTTHAGINVVPLLARLRPQIDISQDAVAEAWDEPLTMAEVLAIVDPFIV